MNKKIIALLITVSLLITMFTPVMAGNGEGIGDDIFNQPGVTVNIDKGAYTLGAVKEFKTDTYCGAYKNKSVVRKIQIQGPSASGFEYYDGAKWNSISGYNKKISLGSDIGRRFRVKFNSVGEYIITYTITDTEGVLLAGSRRYVVVTNTSIDVKFPLTPPDNFSYKKTTTGNTSYHFSWDKKSAAKSYDFYINGKKIGNVTTNSYDVPASYFKANSKNIVGVVLVDEEGMESVMKTVMVVNGTIASTTKSQETSTSKKATVKVSKPEKIKSLSAKNLKGKKVKLTWKKIKGVSGYQIMYAKDKKFKKSKRTVNIKKASTVKKTITKLQKKKTYYFKVRAYNKVNKTTKYGSWSSVEKVKIKK